MKTTMNHTARGVARRLAFLVSALLLVSAAACDGGCGSGSESMPESASARVENMASHLPKSTQVSFIVGDLEGMRTSLKTARDTLGDAMPMTDLIEQQAKNELGIDIFDAESWKNSGIAANSGLSLSVVGTRPVLLTYIKDAQKFEKTFADQLKKSMGIEGMAKSVASGGSQVKVLGADDKTVAWAYDGKLVAVVFPKAEGVKDFSSAEETQDPVKLAAELVTLDQKKSLAADKGFKSFQKALASEQAMAVYINANTVLSESRMAALEQNGDAAQKATAKWVKENVDAFGLSMNVDGNSLRIRGWLSLPEKSLERARAIMTAPTDSPIANFATANTLIGLRTSLDMSKLWTFYKDEVLTKEQRDELTTKWAEAAKESGLNLEKDLITKLTGNLGVVFYGVDSAIVEQANGSLATAVMTKPFETLAILVPIQFKDDASLDKVVDALIKTANRNAKAAAEMMAAGDDAAAGDTAAADEKAAANQAVRTELENGVTVITVPNQPRSRGQFFYKDNLLVYATGAFSNDAVVRYITGDRDDEALGEDARLNLGKNFASKDDYTGLYVNFVRAQEHLSSQLSRTIPTAGAFLKKLEEASLTTEIGDEGAYINLTVDLTPKSAESETDKVADKPSK